jgi:superoxide dismutase, Fe-Mn family
MSAYEVAPLPFKPHRLNGFSEKLMISHYENNHGGAVRRLNAIQRRLAGLDWKAAPFSRSTASSAKSSSR